MTTREQPEAGTGIGNCWNHEAPLLQPGQPEVGTGIGNCCLPCDALEPDAPSPPTATFFLEPLCVFAGTSLFFLYNRPLGVLLADNVLLEPALVFAGT